MKSSAFPRVETLHDGTVLIQVWENAHVELLDIQTAQQLQRRLSQELGVERADDE